MSSFKIPEWAAKPSQAATLQTIDGTDVYDISQQSHYLIGREADLGCTILIDDDASVSRRHAAIVHHQDGRIYIIDLASRTGVLINDTKIAPNKPTQIGNGSRITIGPRTYVFNCATQLPTPKETAAAAAVGAVASDNPTQVRASHLLVKHRDVRNPRSWKEPVVTRNKEEALAMIEAFQEQLRSGQADFATLASVESHCSSAQKGGDLGWFTRGKMMKAFEEPAFGLEVGQMSGPVFSDSGVHLILRTG